MPLSTIFQLYRGGQFKLFGGGNRSTWRKPPTCRKSLTISHNVVSSTPHHERGLNSQLLVDHNKSNISYLQILLGDGY